VLPVLRQLYTVAHNSSYGRDAKDKKSQPKVLRAKLDDGGTIVGKHRPDCREPPPPTHTHLINASTSTPPGLPPNRESEGVFLSGEGLLPSEDSVLLY